MSCGRIALERSGIEVNNYFSSEIDKHAIAVADYNYQQDTKNRLGDTSEWREWELPEIDLLIAGSPCQGFSFAGKQLNFSDPRSALFFEFVNILNHYKPKYFLLENVKMKKEYQDIISSLVGVEPIEINSSLVSAQKRRRLYWTNIPNISQPEDKGVVFKDIIDYSCENMSLYLNNKQIEYGKEKHKGKVWKSGNRMGNMKFPNSVDKKSQCLSAVEIFGARETNHIEDIHGIRVLTVPEYEKLQTLTVGYTSLVDDKQAKKMLGNGWTVDVIAHIFKNLNFYENNA